MREHYMGDDVTSAAGLRPFTGRCAHERLVGADRRLAVRLNYRQLRINYGLNVDFQLRGRMVVLCPQTQRCLYTEFTSTRTSYCRGLRPDLEAVVDDACEGCTSRYEQALALMRVCRDLFRRNSRPSNAYIYGGTEEQLLEKGEELCECLGRLFVALCEIAGIAGRIVMHTIGGHIAAEVLLDDGWAYIDPRCGIHALDPVGKPASLWELWQHPEWLETQPEDVMREVSSRWTWEERVKACRTKYLHPLEVNGFENYSLMDADRYGYSQLTREEAARRGLFVINQVYRGVIDRVFGLSDRGQDTVSAAKS